MNILIVNKYLYKRGGTEITMFALANLLKEKGHNVYFFGLKHPKNIVDNEFLVESVDEEQYKFKDRIKAPFKSIYSAQARKKIKECIEHYNIDIVQIFNFNYDLTPSIIYQSKKMGKKVCLNTPNAQIVCPNSMMYIPQKNELCNRCKNKRFYNCILNKCISESYSKSFAGAVESTVYHSLKTYKKHVDLIFSPSQFLKDKIVEMGFKHDNFKVIPNFVNVTPKETVYKKSNYILYFGKLSNEKGLKTLLYAMKALRNDNILLKIVGEGPLKKDLEKYIYENKLENVQLLGYKNKDQLEKTIRKAIVTVYPSEWGENCPLPVIESLAYGIPVIGSNIGGIPEIIDNDKDGIIFEKGNYMDLACKIKELVNDKVKIEEMSPRAVDKYLSQYTPNIYYENIIKEYNELLRK